MLAFFQTSLSHPRPLQLEAVFSDVRNATKICIECQGQNNK